MGFWRELFFGAAKPTFKGVDWLDVDQRWRALSTLAQSASQADAKQALIQADILVDSIMKQAKVKGETFGERLKSLRPQIQPNVYRKLWQAHIKRNELVHEQGSFVAEWEKGAHLSAFEAAITELRGQR